VSRKTLAWLAYQEKAEMIISFVQRRAIGVVCGAWHMLYLLE
jgi:hypothetical protein